MKNGKAYLQEKDSFENKLRRIRNQSKTKHLRKTKKRKKLKENGKVER